MIGGTDGERKAVQVLRTKYLRQATVVKNKVIVRNLDIVILRNCIEKLPYNAVSNLEKEDKLIFTTLSLRKRQNQ